MSKLAMDKLDIGLVILVVLGASAFTAHAEDQQMERILDQQRQERQQERQQDQQRQDEQRQQDRMDRRREQNDRELDQIRERIRRE